MFIPDIISKGKKTVSGKKVSYELEKNGVVYIVTTEHGKGGEEFTNFYTNRKPTNKSLLNTAKQHGSTSLSVSGANLNNPDGTTKNKTEFLWTSDGVVYGFVEGDAIYLTLEGINPNTPIHEYTHLWDKVLQRANPKLWKRGVELMKECPLWGEVVNDPAYAVIAGDEQLVLGAYDKNITPEQEALLRELNYREYPTIQELSKAKIVSADEKSKDKINSDARYSLAATPLASAEGKGGEVYRESIAATVYENRMASGMVQFREAMQDSMASLSEAMKAILKGEGKSDSAIRMEKIPTEENAYLGENALSSINHANLLTCSFCLEVTDALNRLGEGLVLMTARFAEQSS